MELRLPRSGVNGPRFADIEWIPVKMKARGSQPITQQRQRKAGTTFRCYPSRYVNRVNREKSQFRDHTTIFEVLECISDIVHIP